MKKQLNDLKIFAKKIRLETILALSEIKRGHIGGSMSVAEVLATLYGKEMKIDPENPEWSERDWFVLSKGHCGPALYATLALKGYFPMDTLKTINQPDTILPSHCDRMKTPGIDISTGSLGQGISVGLGVAYGLKLAGKNNFVYVIMGDGECAEGQVWEAALSAAHHKLDNLIIFIDDNKKQLDGYTKDILDFGDIGKKFAEFQWFTQSISGHDIESISDAIGKAKAHKDSPSMIVLNTVKGKDCTFAEDVLYNHHMAFSDSDVNEAVEFLNSEIKKLEGINLCI